jgi:hypothetical protein
LRDETKEFWFWSDYSAHNRCVRRLNILKREFKKVYIGGLSTLIGRLTNSSWDELYSNLKQDYANLSYADGFRAFDARREKKIARRKRRRRRKSPPEVKTLTSLPLDEGNDRSLRMTGPEVIQALGGPKARFSGQTRREARAPELKLSVDTNRDPDYRWIPEPWYRALQATGLPGSAYRKADVTKPFFKEDGPTMYGKSPAEFQRMALDRLVFSVPAKDRDKIHAKVNQTLNEFAAEKAAEASSSKPRKRRGSGP